MDVFQILGFVGCIAFNIGNIPQGIKMIQEGHCRGISGLTVVIWLVGYVSMLIYSIGMYTGDNLLIMNYLFNLLFVLMIVWYKIFPRC